MKVTSIDIFASNSNSTINVSYRDPAGQNPYVAKSIIGLDADEITSMFYRVSDQSNKKYYNLSLKKRDVVMQIGLNPDFSLDKTYSDLRDDLYKLIASSRTGSIQLHFKDGVTKVAAISGFITKFEAPQFTKTPEVQLTISCTDPMLKALTPVNEDVTVLDPSFTSIVDDKSTSPHGFRFGMIFTSTSSGFTIQDILGPSWAFEVDLTGSPLVNFVVGDELHFSSENNNRYLYLIRGFNVIHLVDRIIPTSVWPILFPGENNFICINPVNWDYITYYPTYWGV